MRIFSFKTKSLIAIGNLASKIEIENLKKKDQPRRYIPERDLVPYVFYQELNNLKHMELTATVWIDPEAIMQPWPEEENRLRVAIKPFQLMVKNYLNKLLGGINSKTFVGVQLWITFISCTAIFILTTTAFVKIQEKYDPIDDHPHKSIGETVYHQFEFVIRIKITQGK